MRRALLVLWVATLASTGLVSAGCAKKKVIVVNGVEVYETIWNRTLDELHPRVEFDFNCPPGQVEFALLRRVGRYPTEVGVTGCGRRGTFVRAVGPYAASPWVLSAQSRVAPTQPGDQPAPAPSQAL